MWARGIEADMLPHAKGLGAGAGAGAGDPIKAFSGCSHDGLTCVAGTSSSCVKLSDACVPSNEAKVARRFDAGRCEAPRDFFADDLGVEDRSRPPRLRMGGPSLGFATENLAQACDIVVGHGSVPRSGCCKKKKTLRYKSEAQNPTYVFFHDFVEAGHERTPLEELDGFFDGAGLGRGEFHEHVE